jgi:hypothetical protein
MYYFQSLANVSAPAQLRFHALFEGGNLHSAFQMSRVEYDLIVRNDINNDRYSEWFYFVFKLDNRPVRLNILADNVSD